MRLAAELFSQAFLPSNLAALSFEANKIAIRAQSVNEISVNRGSGPGLRVIRVLIRIAYVADAS